MEYRRGRIAQEYPRRGRGSGDPPGVRTSFSAELEGLTQEPWGNQCGFESLLPHAGRPWRGSAPSPLRVFNTARPRQARLTAMSLLSIVLLAATALDPTCGPAPAAQERATQASDLPAEKLAALEGELERLAEQHHIPGMSAAVVHRRALAWSRGFGYADLEQGTWAMPDTRYQVASVAKPIAAVLILQLVEEGKLSLDAPMKDFR